jgi:preprotein translocase subunit SecG
MTLLAAFSFVGFLKGLLMLVCILSALLLMLVVLLQEPKGGGLSSAFGGAGAETFGVQTGSVNKFTAWVAGIFMMSALLYAAIRPGEGASVMDAPPASVDTPVEGD